MSGNGDLAVVASTDGVFTVDPTASFASNGFYGNSYDNCKNKIEKKVIDFSKLILYFTHPVPVRWLYLSRTHRRTRAGRCEQEKSLPRVYCRSQWYCCTNYYHYASSCNYRVAWVDLQDRSITNQREKNDATLPIGNISTTDFACAALTLRLTLPFNQHSYLPAFEGINARITSVPLALICTFSFPGGCQ